MHQPQINDCDWWLAGWLVSWLVIVEELVYWCRWRSELGFFCWKACFCLVFYCFLSVVSYDNVNNDNGNNESKLNDGKRKATRLWNIVIELSLASSWFIVSNRDLLRLTEMESSAKNMNFLFDEFQFISSLFKNCWNSSF